METRSMFPLLLGAVTVFKAAPSAEAFTLSSILLEAWNMVALTRTTTVVEYNATTEELNSSVIFDLFTSSNAEDPQIIYLGDDETLENSNFNASNPTRIVIHGWQSSVDEAMATGIRDAYIGQGDFNIFLVDWDKYTSEGYLFARRRIVTVGKHVGRLIDFLVDQGMNIEDLTVIGHSLGAHVAAVGCRSANSTVPILIALDPAGPLFYKVDLDAKMKSTDAGYVQVIHTNSGLLGHKENLGDVDFWPNGGSSQSGCIDLVCCHKRAYYFFIESITSNSSKFVAYPCKSYNDYKKGAYLSKNSTYFGGLIPETSANGTYCLGTNNESPYAQG